MRKNLLKNSAIYITGSIIVQAMGFTGLILLMNFLPVSEYGKYIYIIELISIFAFFSDGGFSQYIIKEATQNPQDIKSIYSRAQSSQVIISLLMLALIILVNYPTNSLTDFYLLLIFGLSVVATAFFSPILAVLIASERKDIIFYKDVATSSAKLAFIGLGIFLELPIIYFICLGFINFIILIIMALWIRHKKEFSYFLNTKIDFTGNSKFIKQGALFTVLMAANVIYNKIDIVMLEKMRGSVEVGYYSGATRFIYPFMFISGAFMTAIFPSLARFSSDPEKFQKIQYLALYYLGGLGIVLSSVLFLSSEFIFHFFFGEKYDSSIPVFKILVWYLAIVFIYGSISNNLVAKNRVKFLVYLNIVMIIANISINLILIPIYGALGAAISTIACEMAILLVTTTYWLVKVKN